MDVTVNGERMKLEQDALDVGALLRQIRADGAARGIAVAVNGSVVPRSQWDAHPLADGDEIEIVQATQGG